MASPLSGGLAAQIYSGMRFLFLDATLTRDVPATPSPDAEDFDPALPTEVEYDCKAIHENYAERFRLEGTVSARDRKVIILANSLDVVPEKNDRITIRSQTFTIDEVETDPALATYTCRARV